MKKFLILILGVLVGSQAFCQTDNTIKFLGIPVDGTKFEVTQQLKKKGFTYLDGSDGELLEGEFNGKNVHLSVVENHGKVWRIAVFDAQPVSEGQIRIRFNELISQFENSGGKYVSIIPNERISDDEDISYEIAIHDKQYQASFLYNPYYNNDEFKKRIVKEAAEEFEKTKPTGKCLGLDMTYEEFYSDEKNVQTAIMTAASLKLLKMLQDHVWFTIGEFHGKYYICMYYDNLNNKPNGEDL